VRGSVALLTLTCCLGATGPATAQAASTPKFQLLGDWRFHGDRYRFVRHNGAVFGHPLAAVRIGHCLIRKGTSIFRGYRFRGTHGGVDYWRGRLAVVGGDCERRLVASRITMRSDLRFSESSRLPGGGRPPPNTFTRIRPRVSANDPVIGTWLRSSAGVVVTLQDGLYVGRAREAFKIMNECFVSAGAVVWRLRPLAPDRYSGTVQTFLDPPGCAPAALVPSTWRFGATRNELLRYPGNPQPFLYTRAT
jgi:hypothetical protein